MIPIIDPEVYKIKDQRVTAVQHGKMSLQAFVYCLKSVDWFILLNNTVYALSEVQYYAICSTDQPAQDITKDIFQKLLQNISWASTEDQKILNNIKNSYRTCSACQYKRYMTTVRQLVLKYPDTASRYKLIKTKKDLPAYPAVTEPIIQKVTSKLGHIFNVKHDSRKPCFECVIKHIGQAYFEYHQTLLGYPEHFMLVIGNLAQAFQECPEQAKALRQTLMFCIGKSQKQKKAFVPAGSLLMMVQYYMNKSHPDDVANTKNQPSVDMALQLTEQDINKLEQLPSSVKVSISVLIKTLLKKLNTAGIDDNTVLKAQWAGGMANLSDAVADISVQIASIIRNRRLLFKELPSACIGTQYDCSDILMCVESGSDPG